VTLSFDELSSAVMHLCLDFLSFFLTVFTFDVDFFAPDECLSGEDCCWCVLVLDVFALGIIVLC
jgi:hypothetical protein